MNDKKLPARRWRRLALAVAVTLASIGLYYGKWQVVDHRLVTITTGEVFQSAAMPVDTLVATMRDHGMRAAIDLRDGEQDLVAAEAKALAAVGLTHLHVPMSVNPGPADVRAFLRAMATAPRPVLVHCQHGEGRSVLMCALYRIDVEGWSNEAAFDATARLPEGLRPLHWLIPPLFRFTRDSHKGRMVLDHPRRPPSSR